MKMELTGHMRLEQRMKLAPRMIQSMEVLQLPLLALQEKSEAELNSNPVLEIDESKESETEGREEEESRIVSDERELVVDPDGNNAEDFRRLDSLDDDFRDLVNQSQPMRTSYSSEEVDSKYEALQNTMAPQISLRDYLLEQWGLLDVSEGVFEAGRRIIDYIDKKGYLTVHLEQLYNKDRCDFSINDLREALGQVQMLEPSGVGASDVRECLLLQLDQMPENMVLAKVIVEDYYNLLLENKLPEIAKKTGYSLEDINWAIKKLSKLDISPGLRIGGTNNRPVTADVIIEANEDGDGFVVRLASATMPSLRVNEFYLKMAKNRDVGEKTRHFLQQNIRSAQWLMDAIEQRKSTLLKVSTAIVHEQEEFFEKGSLFLKPLPMQKIADVIGVHVATVSRAVAGKYVQCSQGILPLRSFFSGGTESVGGETQSWDAVKALLQKIVDEEDKAKPLNDDKLAEKLKEQGVNQIARRTVAKYRKLLNIPSARFRKKY